MILYALTDERDETDAAFLARVESALNGGVQWVQFREKRSSMEKREHRGRELVRLCKDYDVKCIVNDSVELALAIEAHGVHLGKSDGSITAARQLLSDNSIIGATCHDDFPSAITAQRDGATYVAFGAMYPSPTKPHAIRASLDTVKRAKAELNIPVCCIGGITPKHIPDLAVSGADIIAVASAIFNAANPQQAARAFREKMDANR